MTLITNNLRILDQRNFLSDEVQQKKGSHLITAFY